tara:strand:+ start:1251 stop:1826 length:576 start_codon:yes stop_codon:yes gene_type:complete
MRTLELFCGTKSFSKYFFCDNVSVDIDPKTNPTICVDILEWDYTSLGDLDFNIIWASPPCIEYSTCLTTRPRDLEHADKVVKRTLEIIEYFNPDYWYLENPYTGLLKTRPIMENRYFFIVDYCKYGYNYRKRTAIWTNNLDYKPRPLCKKDCGSVINGKHIGHFGTGGASCNLNSKYSVPRELIEDIRSYR